MEQAVVLNNKTYELVKIQRADISAIYKNSDEYLRIGDKKKITKDLENHRNMEKASFPVAKILEEGELDGMQYFLETSLGEQMIGEIFQEDIQQLGVIRDANFNIFLLIVESFAKAQLNTKKDTETFDIFTNSIHLDILCNELPEYSKKIQSIFLDIKARLSVFPFVLTHGDFNPNNIYPDGVIDFEDSFYGPFGYDIVGALVHIDYFPSSPEYEYFAKYRFTTEQKGTYLSFVDSISEQRGLPKLSEFEKDFEFCRAVWLLVKMHKMPKLQKFRYDLFIERFLK